MSNFGNHVLTDAGKAAEAEAHLPGKKLTFTKLAIGSGALGTPATATGLANHQMNLGITQVNRDPNNANWVRIRSVFNNTALTTGFNFKEIGVFAKIDSEPEVLYSYATDQGAGDSIPSYDGANPVVVYPTVIVIIDSSIDIHADITVGADFECENIGPPTVGPGWFAQKIGNTFQFKRAIQGAGIDLIEGPDTVEIGLREITIDLDLRVTHTPIGPLDFPDLFAALAHANTLTIPAERKITIRVDEGRWEHNRPIDIIHPQADRLEIIGTRQQVTATSGSFATGGVVTVNAAVGAFTGWTVGDLVIVRRSGSDPLAGQVSGCWVISAVAANGSWLQYNSGYGTLAAGVGGQPNLVNAVISRLASQIRLTSSAGNRHAFRLGINGLGLLGNIGIQSVGTGISGVTGIGLGQGTAIIDHVGCYGFLGVGNNGAAFDVANGALLNSSFCAASRCGNGWVTSRAQQNCTSCYATNCREGWYGLGGSDVQLTDCWAMGNSDAGMIVSNQGFLGITAVSAWYNRIGISVSNGSNVSQGNAGSAFNNGTRDIEITVLSMFIRNNPNAMLIGTCNIAPNVLSAQGCWYSP